MPSIHFLCRPAESGGHLRLSEIDATQSKSACWYFLPSMRGRIDELVGGWIYLHEKKDQPSYTGGVIARIEPCKRKNSDGVAFIFEKRPEGQRQSWRGLDHAKAMNSWIVPYSFPHEMVDASRS